MKYYLKKTYYLCTNVFNTIVSLLSVLLFSSYSCNKRMKQCEKKYKKVNECVVMGNGPSIMSLFENNYSVFFNKDIFAVNYFCSTNYFELVKPNFYVLLDPDIFAESPSGKAKQNIDTLIAKFNDISWEMVLFIPVNFKNTKLLEHFVNRKLTIVPFNSTPIHGIKSIENYLFKKDLGMPMPQTVINAVIFLAINMKYDIIHLYGVEQSWLKYLSVSNNNKVSVGLPHFYGGSDDIGEHRTLRTLSAFLLTQAAAFKSHMRLQEYAKHNGKRILNHTPGSYIDAYERVINET